MRPISVISVTIGSQTCTGEELRQILRLPSASFVVEQMDGKVRFVQRSRSRAWDESVWSRMHGTARKGVHIVKFWNIILPQNGNSCNEK